MCDSETSTTVVQNARDVAVRAKETLTFSAVPRLNCCEGAVSAIANFRLQTISPTTLSFPAGIPVEERPERTAVYTDFLNTISSRVQQLIREIVCKVSEDCCAALANAIANIGSKTGQLGVTAVTTPVASGGYTVGRDGTLQARLDELIRLFNQSVDFLVKITCQN
jgi:hypothetical protein